MANQRKTLGALPDGKLPTSGRRKVAGRARAKASVIKVSLWGPLRMIDGRGVSRAPSLKKARALVALLMTSENQTRSRSWLQSHLWSEDCAKNAASNLRKALSNLRNALGPHKDCLVTEHDWVQLDPKRVRVAEPCGDARDDMEFLEGIDLDDPQFEEWLRDQRLFTSFKTLGRSPSRSEIIPVLMIGRSASRNLGHAMLRAKLIAKIRLCLQELGAIRVIDLQDDSLDHDFKPKSAAFLSLSILSADGTTRVDACVESVIDDHRQVWPSNGLSLPTGNEDQCEWQLNKLALDCTYFIQKEFERSAQIQDVQCFAYGFANRAVRTIFSFEREDLIEGDRLLMAAHRLAPSSLYASWRAFIRNTALFEHHGEAFLPPMDLSELRNEAVLDDKWNSYALVFEAQHSFVRDRNLARGEDLCDEALRINPANPLGWAFRSNILVQQNRTADAVQAIERGLMLSHGLPQHAAVLLNAVMAYTAQGDFEKAIRYGERCELTHTKCQAIQRFLFVLYTRMDKPELARRALQTIRKREPGFKPTDLLDSSYPTWTLQKLRIADAFAARSAMFG